MKISILAIGRARSGPETDIFDTYRKRLPWPVALVERDARKRGTPAARQAEEGALLLAALPKGAWAVVLDGSGRQMTSEDFAATLRAVRDDGVGDVAFLIGGADGHNAEVLARADTTLSLGVMTWPHLLVRAMLAEQLYRASTILAGHPYHRG